MRPLAISNISIFNIFHKILFNPIRRLIMKLVIILHGISGSGKSTTAKKFIEKYSKDNSNLSYSIHSTDDLFVEDGVYKFDPTKLSEYHELNQDNFKSSLKDNVELVIVDNTNIFPEHWEPYVTAASSMEYKVQHFWLPIIDADTAFSRNIHNVPMHAIERQIENYKKYYPN